MSTGFRRKLLILVVAMVVAVGGAGIVVAVIFGNTLERTVALEERSGRILRSAREVQLVGERQRALFLELLLRPAGPGRDSARAKLEAGSEELKRFTAALRSETAGDPELEPAMQRYDAALGRIRTRSETLFAEVEAVAALQRFWDETETDAAGTRSALEGLIDTLRRRQSLRMTEMNAELDAQLRRMLIGFVLVVLGSGAALFWFLDRNFAQPMARSIRTAREVADGGLHRRIPVDHDVEFGIFPLAFNRMLEELTRTKRDLADANRELESFSFTISHDLRAPLRSIIGFSGILREEAAHRLNPDEISHLERIESAAARMGSMIQDLLEIARIGRGELHCEALDLSAMAAEVLAELRAGDPSRAVDVLVEPGIRAWGDPGLVRVVLDNLLGNAWKYTARTAPARIEFGHERGETELGFFVRDNGAGFDPSLSAKLFRPFQRLHNADEFEGTGIGLATVQRIIARHGGRIEASAQPGRGASFRVWLPSGSLSC